MTAPFFLNRDVVDQPRTAQPGSGQHPGRAGSAGNFPQRLGVAHGHVIDLFEPGPFQLLPPLFGLFGCIAAAADVFGDLGKGAVQNRRDFPFLFRQIGIA